MIPIIAAIKSNDDAAIVAHFSASLARGSLDRRKKLANSKYVSIQRKILILNKY